MLAIRSAATQCSVRPRCAGATRASFIRRPVSVVAAAQPSERRAVLGGLVGGMLLAGAKAPANAAEGVRETLDAMYLAFNKGDLEGVLCKIAPRATLEFPSFTPKPIYFGPEGFKEFADYLFSKAEDSTVTVTNRFVSGNDAVYLAKVTLTKSRKAGKVKTLQVAHFWSFKDGKVVAFREYADAKAIDKFLSA